MTRNARNGKYLQYRLQILNKIIIRSSNGKNILETAYPTPLLLNELKIPKSSFYDVCKVLNSEKLINIKDLRYQEFGRKKSKVFLQGFVSITPAGLEYTRKNHPEYFFNRKEDLFSKHVKKIIDQYPKNCD